MFFFLFGQGSASENEFISLKAKREEIQSQVEALLNNLRNTEQRFEFLSAIYQPRINIIEVNNKSMGNRYIGRFSIPGIDGKPKRFTVSLAKANEYEDKKDPQLAKLAKTKALELLQRKHPELFREKS